MRHVRWYDNIVADILSRVSTGGLPVETIAAMGGVRADFVDYVAMAKQQATDIGAQRLVSEPTYALQLVHCALANTDECLLVDVSTGKPRPLVPAAWTWVIFNTNLELAHAGDRAMHRLICDRSGWHGMTMDIRHWTRSRMSCQRTKVTTHVKALADQLPTSTNRLESLHVDLVVPFPPSQGFAYLLTIVDRQGMRQSLSVPMDGSVRYASYSDK